MKNFFKDYWDLCKMSWKFCKDHWFGVMLYIVICIVLMFVPRIIDEYEDKKFIQKVLNDMKKEKENSSETED